MTTIDKCKEAADYATLLRESRLTDRPIDAAELIDHILSEWEGDELEAFELASNERDNEVTINRHKKAFAECLDIIRQDKGTKQDRLDAIEEILSSAF